mmetsp:Transcript_109878/g.261981  ORF Transcript_109878/g.261981 Transcript_109878/m.261981 type:complete len:122 (-) Transcript_109878:13-378(-)
MPGVPGLSGVASVAVPGMFGVSGVSGVSSKQCLFGGLGLKEGVQGLEASCGEVVLPGSCEWFTWTWLRSTTHTWCMPILRLTSLGSSTTWTEVLVGLLPLGDDMATLERGWQTYQGSLNDT